MPTKTADVKQPGGYSRPVDGRDEEALRELCRRMGVATEYTDALGAHRRATSDTLISILRALDAEIRTVEDVRRVLEAAPSNVPRAAKRVGVFAPMYSLFDSRDPRRGGLACFRDFVDWVADAGGTMVCTLPVLAAFLDRRAGMPFEPSPYAPVSRVALNELFTNLADAREFHGSEAARARYEAPEFREAMAREVAAPLVDYEVLHRLRRPILEELSKIFDVAPDRASRLRAAGSHVEPYAEFRAQGAPDELRYHRYAQVLAHEQLMALRAHCGARGVELYLDFPIGVHADGFDVRREGDLFARGVSVGAPPDAMFSGGQNWGFPPIHPGRSQATGHAYFRECLAFQMQYAHVLRIDHILGFHRQFWIPASREAAAGTYVQFPGRELYEVVAREAMRAKCRVIGENLGTVPPEVGPMMREFQFAGMYVLPFEIGHDIRPPGGDVVALLNTHDMPTFAGFVKGLDICDREDLGLLDRGSAIAELEMRAYSVERFRAALGRYGYGEELQNMTALRDAAFRYLADSDAADVLLNAEDLWLAEQPQNVPGTYLERPNFRRRFAYGVDQLAQFSPIVAGVARRTAGGSKGSR